MPREEPPNRRVLVTTSNGIEGREIAEYLGVVRGIVVRAQTIGQGLRGSISSIFGGNIRAWEEVCESARPDAYQRMVEHARDKGADAIIAMRYDATEFATGVTEVLAYGTAVRLAARPSAESTEAIRTPE
jgi:uncharacterized protein YbjQ (UPF0145 family)